MPRLLKFLRDNSLSIVLFLLFAACLCLQSLAGWRDQNDTLLAHGAMPIGFKQFLTTGAFIEGLAVNWQAAILQLASLIVFSSFLYQRGAPHSRDPNKHRGKHRRRGDGLAGWLWRHSLELAFAALFVATLAVHILFGLKADNDMRTLQGRPPLALGEYVTSAKFWSATLQTWQAEYLVIGLYIVLSIYLRQENSAESKPTDSPDSETGEHNE